MSNRQKTAIVVGGGIAGLAAAHDLAKHGWGATLLEARQRLGGRILTVRSANIPVELGAEFVHGKNKRLWQLIRDARLSTHEVPNKQSELSADGSLQVHDFWSEIGKVLGQIDTEKPDQTFAKFVRSIDCPPHLKRLSMDFVEGFNAARADRISVHALAQSEETSEQIDGTRQFRVQQGYGRLVDWLARNSRRSGAKIQLGAEVQTIRWKPGAVEVEFLQRGRTRKFSDSAAIITLPLGVLKTNSVRFEPKLRQKREAVESLEFGAVTKITLHFSSRFWPRPNFGFVHAFDEWLPTWWSDPRGNVVTGWAGGPKGERLAARSHQFIVARAVETLSKIFDERAAKIRGLLIDAQSHNWSNDPLSRGAYSYCPVGMKEVPKMLAEPVEQTLFFAGEAATLDGQLGTIHGALETGLRAAQQLRGA